MTQPPPSPRTSPGPSSGRPWKIAGIILLALYVVAGAIYSFALPPVARFPDEAEYLALVHNLQHGPGYSMDGVHLTAARPPGYPFFLFTLNAAGGGFFAMRLSQYLMVAATLLLVCQLAGGNRWSPRLLAVVILVWAYPAYFYVAGTLYPQTLGGFLFILSLVLLLRGQESALRYVISGLVFGALILDIPTFAFTLLVVLGVAWILRMIRWHQGLLVLVGSALLITPWTMRNYLQFHQFVPLASNSGLNFLLGNCENTNPVGGSDNIDISHYQAEARALGLNEFQTDHYYRAAALKWIHEHPGQALILYVEKTLNFFNVWNEYSPHSQGEVSLWKQAVMATSYVVLIALLAWRLLGWKSYPLSNREKLFLATYLLSAFTMALFFSRIRYRLPYDYLIIIIVADYLSRRLFPTLADRSSYSPESAASS